MKAKMVLDLGGSLPRWPGPDDPRSRSRRDGTDRPPAPRQPRGSLLYERVVELVEQLIAERGLVPGDMLPSYTELADHAGVSLITVRRALDELERAGCVRRHQGVGTFVTHPRIAAEAGEPGSLLAGLTSAGPAARLETRVLGLHQGQPSAEMCRVLGIGRASMAWQLRRLHQLDDRPAVLEATVIPVALAPEFDALADRLGESLADVLAGEYRLVNEYEEQYIEVLAPDEDAAGLLELPGGAHAVRVRGLSADGAGRPFACFEQLYPADRFALAFSGSATRYLLPAPGPMDWAVRRLS